MKKDLEWGKNEEEKKEMGIEKRRKRGNEVESRVWEMAEMAKGIFF